MILMRYGHQQLPHLLGLPVHRLLEFADAICDLVAKENEHAQSQER